MDIYISDIQSDAMHPRATGIGDLGRAIEEVFPNGYNERANLEQLLILMLIEIRTLKEKVNTLQDKQKT